MVKEADIKKLRGKISEAYFKNPRRRKQFLAIVHQMELCSCFPAKVLHSQLHVCDDNIKKILVNGSIYAENNNCKAAVYYKIMNLKLIIEQKRFLTYMLNPDLLFKYLDNFIYTV